MLKLAVIGLGGFFGAVARYGLSGLVHRYSGGAFPFGTLIVNLLGCFLIGAVMAVVEGREALSPNVRLFVVIGLLGSFTTFSTLGYETLELLRSREHLAALANMGGSAVLGVLAVVAGHVAVRLLG